VLVSDMQYLVPVGMQVLFYLTPVMYPPGLLRQKGLHFLECNPLTSFLELLRAPILDGVFPSLQAFAVASGSSLAITVVAVLGLVVMQRRLVFYL
jgi:lipopolysaccharide transport system permease protein